MMLRIVTTGPLWSPAAVISRACAASGEEAAAAKMLQLPISPDCRPAMNQRWRRVAHVKELWHYHTGR
jgi:hypothetical protein